MVTSSAAQAPTDQRGWAVSRASWTRAAIASVVGVYPPMLPQSSCSSSVTLLAMGASQRMASAPATEGTTSRESNGPARSALYFSSTFRAALATLVSAPSRITSVRPPLLFSAVSSSNSPTTFRAASMPSATPTGHSSSTSRNATPGAASAMAAGSRP